MLDETRIRHIRQAAKDRLAIVTSLDEQVQLCDLALANLVTQYWVKHKQVHTSREYYRACVDVLSILESGGGLGPREITDSQISDLIAICSQANLDNVDLVARRVREVLS